MLLKPLTLNPPSNTTVLCPQERFTANTLGEDGQALYIRLESATGNYWTARLPVEIVGTEGISTPRVYQAP